MADQLLYDMPTVLDENANPVADGTIEVYEENTTTLVNLIDASGDPLSNPISLDAGGRPAAQAFYAGSTPVDVVIKDSAGVQLRQIVSAPRLSAVGAAASKITFSPITGNAATDTQAAIENNTNAIERLALDGTRGFRNVTINGQMLNWPEGTTFSGSGNITDQYYCDGWQVFGASSSSWTLERYEFDQTVEAHPIDGRPQYAMEIISQATSLRFRNPAEGVETLAGKTATITVHLFSSVAGTLAGKLVQKFGSGGAASADAESAVTTTSISVGWNRVDYVIGVSNIIGKTIDGEDDSLETNLLFTPDSTVAPYTVRMTEVSTVPGDSSNEDVPGAWETDTDEFYRCRELFVNHTTDEIIFSSDVTSGLNYYLWVPFQRRMRAVPDVLVTIPSANRFTTDPPVILLTTVDGFYVQKSASATGFGWFQVNYTADARL